MTLQEYTHNLPEDRQFKLAVKLTKLALPIWDNYADKNDLTYRDTVVGMHHSVDRKLLLNTINAIEEYLNLNRLKKLFDGKSKLLELSGQFDDPVVALQDMDWELPDEVLKTFYSVHNMLDTLVGKEQTVFGDSTIYVSINQAIDALETSKSLSSAEIKMILAEIKSSPGENL